jgi:microcompartment protein CcmK/EutM
MILGTVRGNIVSTINHPFYGGRKMLVVEREDFAGKPSGYLIAVDGGVNAGVGERVLVIDEGNSARQVVADPKAPLRSIIVGIVDRVDTEERAEAGRRGPAASGSSDRPRRGRTSSGRRPSG